MNAVLGSWSPLLQVASGKDQEQTHHDAVLQDRKDLLVGDVAGLELAGLAVKHRPYLLLRPVR